MLQIGRAVFVRRRADGDELQRAVRNARLDVGREAQPAGTLVLANHRLESRLEDRHAARVELRDLGGIEIEAQHVVADFGQTGAGDETHIAGADDGDFHSMPSSVALMPASVARGSADCVIGRPITR